MHTLRLLYLASAASAIASAQAWPGALWPLALFKPLTTALAIVYAARQRGAPWAERRAVLAGLALSLLGDVALLWPQQGFVPGLVAFLLAHLAYLWAFTRGAALARPRWPFAAYAALAAMILALLWPGVPAPLRVPVLAYVACLAAMAAQALCRWQAGAGGATDAPRHARAAFGAALFLVSDALLATHRFHTPLAWEALWVLATYWSAQWLIGSSLAAPAGADSSR